VHHGLADERVAFQEILDVLGGDVDAAAVTIRSFLRSVMKRKPSESIVPMSPVANQPSGRKTSAVASGFLK